MASENPRRSLLPTLSSLRHSAAARIGSAPYVRKWLVLGLLIGAVAGLGAVVFVNALELATHFLLGVVGGYTPPSPANEGGITAAGHFARAWAIPLIVGFGGLVSGPARLPVRSGGRGARDRRGHRRRAPRPQGHQPEDAGRQAHRLGDHHRFRRLRRARGPHRPDQRRLRLVPRARLVPQPGRRAHRRDHRHRGRHRGHLPHAARRRPRRRRDPLPARLRDGGDRPRPRSLRSSDSRSTARSRASPPSSAITPDLSSTGRCNSSTTPSSASWPPSSACSTTRRSGLCTAGSDAHRSPSGSRRPSAACSSAAWRSSSPRSSAPATAGCRR